MTTKLFVVSEGIKKEPKQIAGEILSFFTRKNFNITDRGETITGAYHWKKASRKEEIKVMMLVGDKGKLGEIVVQGDNVQVEEMRKELQLSEKGMVYVKGLFERSRKVYKIPFLPLYNSSKNDINDVRPASSFAYRI